MPDETQLCVVCLHTKFPLKTLFNSITNQKKKKKLIIVKNPKHKQKIWKKKIVSYSEELLVSRSAPLPTKQL